jgi:hypothetical protein
MDGFPQFAMSITFRMCSRTSILSVTPAMRVVDRAVHPLFAQPSLTDLMA